MLKYINLNNLKRGLFDFRSKKPFPYAIVDNFFNKNIAKKLEMEFPAYKDKNLHEYKNDSIDIKRSWSLACSWRNWILRQYIYQNFKAK